jgi:predicted membrane-bound spermidine synthase
MAVPTIEPAAARDPLGAGLRRYLYFTAAATGAAILVVEILGAKMLAPYLGTSHFVWTAQIAVTLISLAAGYSFGGWLVDRSAHLPRLYHCILAAAGYLCFTIPLCEPIAYRCLRFQLAAGALLASLFLFFVPLTLLAVTGPFLIRVLTSTVSQVGGQAGRLSAISTLGSVLGTVLIGYVLIPFLPNSITMYVTGGVLMAIVVIYFAVWGRNSPNYTLVAGALCGLTAGYYGVKSDLHPQWEDYKQLARSNSNFGQLQVVAAREGPPIRYYLNDYLTQNGYDPAEKKSVNLFTYMLHGLAHAYCRQTSDVLCIGMGVGIVPMKFAREGAKVDVVEINDAVVPVAQQYFDLQPEKLNLMINDGRYYLNGCTKKYDVIILDAFLGDSSPSHLMTREAFRAMQRALKPEGVLVMNSFGELDPPGDFLGASLEKTLQSVFKSVRIHSDGLGNMFFVASDQPRLIFPEWRPQPEDVHRKVTSRVEDTFNSICETDPARGIVLTDNYNPTEFYDATNREELRKRVALKMKHE